jgi:hypothetical protein
MWAHTDSQVAMADALHACKSEPAMQQLASHMVMAVVRFILLLPCFAHAGRLRMHSALHVATVMVQHDSY